MKIIMKAYIITIGDEILIGQTLNSNAAYIGSKLTDIGLDIVKTSVIADDQSQIINEFTYAYNNFDLVIVTGGLGPTHDDITKRCIADFFETELEFNQTALDDAKRLFEKRGMKFSESNREQALFPKDADLIRNTKGTAPGIWIEQKGKIFAAMPGVPFEMMEMMSNFIIPKLTEITSASRDKYRVITNLLTTGIAESHLYEALGNLEELLNTVKLAFLPSQFGVKLRLTAIADSEEKAHDNIIEVEQKIRGLVGRFIYGKDDFSIEAVLGNMLRDRDLTIAVAESCTGGLISNRLTNISGSSSYFERGVIAYSNAAKVEFLKVDEDLILENGAVSLEVVRQMAEGIKAVSGTDIGLAVTGVMGPLGGTDEKPVGTVFIGICDEKICTAKEYHFGDDRMLNKDRTSQAALDMLRKHLLGITYES